MNDFLQNCIGIAIIMIAFCCETESKYRRSEPRLPKPKNK